MACVLPWKDVWWIAEFKLAIGCNKPNKIRNNLDDYEIISTIRLYNLTAAADHLGLCALVGSNTQGDLFTQSPAPAESGFQIKTGPTSYAATSKVKRDKSLQWAGAVIMSILAVIGCVARVAKVVLQEQRFSQQQQRQQEERRQQQIYRMPPPPPISTPRSFNVNEFNQRNKKYREPWQK